MVEPEKPFACTMPDCGMTFTNEDHLNVHTKKHDMVLQFGCEQKAAVFVADQTPTPTRFIRNCEEVGLFQDLQNVNPFDEGFKRAIETRQGMISAQNCGGSEELHTPQMYPLEDSMFTPSHQRTDITISRSSSDENGAIKEFETTRISKLTNEVTTISRIVEKHDDTPRNKEKNISYTNNIIKIQSNVEIRTDTEIENVGKDGKEYERLQVEVPPIMSQKSIDYVVDSLTSDFVNDKTQKELDRQTNPSIKEKNTKPTKEPHTERKKEDYEVILKLPSGKEIKLVNADDSKPKNTKDLLKKVITEKVETQKVNQLRVVPILPTLAGGTLIPVSIVNSNVIPKLPLKVEKKPMRRKCEGSQNSEVKRNKEGIPQNGNISVPIDLDSRSAASRRYRARLKETMSQQALENKLLKEQNEILTAQKAALKSIIIDHVKRCHCLNDLRHLQEKLSNIEERK